MDWLKNHYLNHRCDLSYFVLNNPLPWCDTVLSPGKKFDRIFPDFHNEKRIFIILAILPRSTKRGRLKNHWGLVTRECTIEPHISPLFIVFHIDFSLLFTSLEPTLSILLFGWINKARFEKKIKYKCGENFSMQNLHGLFWQLAHTLTHFELAWMKMFEISPALDILLPGKLFNSTKPQIPPKKRLGDMQNFGKSLISNWRQN